MRCARIVEDFRGMCEKCRELLSQALDLCVRARKMDEIDRREGYLRASTNPKEWEESGMFDRFVERHNAQFPHKACATQSETIPLWFHDQYEKDLHEWEKASRAHLMQGCSA